MSGIGRIFARDGRRDRDEEAELRAAYAEHGAGLFRLASRSLGDRGLAEEVVQDTFVQAWKARERFDAARGSRRTWLFAIARNRIVDAARARASRPPAGGRPADHEQGRTTVEDQTERVLTRMHVEEALGRIGAEHREVIVEVSLRGRPYAEVAGELGVPVGTLRSRMYYGLKSLRLVLEEMEHASE